MGHSYIDNLFLNLGEIAYSVKEEGLNCTELEELNLKYDSKDIVYKYLEDALNLSKKGYSREKLECELSYELNKICYDINVDDVTLKSLHIIKSLINPIIYGDYEFILGFSKYYCSMKVYNNLNNVFSIYIKAI